MNEHDKQRALVLLLVTFFAAMVITPAVTFLVEEVYQFVHPLKAGGTMRELLSLQFTEVLLRLIFLSQLYGLPVASISLMQSKWPLFHQSNAVAVGITLALSLLTGLWISSLLMLNCGDTLPSGLRLTMFVSPYFIPWLFGAHIVHSGARRVKRDNLWKVYALVFAFSIVLIYFFSLCLGQAPPEQGEILLAHWQFLLPSSIALSALITGCVSDAITKREFVPKVKATAEEK